MCGIAGIYRFDRKPIRNLDTFAGALLDGIESRGEDATGYVAFDDAGAVQLQKASCRALYFNQNRATIMEDARMVLLHTRFATQGKAAFPENNHPVVAGGVYCVHNGHIFNDSEVFRRSRKTRAGQVDSEAIPALVASKGWQNLPSSLEELDGGFAVALASPKHPGELVLAKGPTYPLAYIRTQSMLVWCSSVWAIQQAWKDAYGTPPQHNRFNHLNEGQALMIDHNGVRMDRFEPPWKPVTLLATKELAAAPAPSKLETALAYLDQRIRDRQRVDPEENDQEDDWMQCDDCGDWLGYTDLTLAANNLLCPSCYSWSVKAGMIE